MIDDVVILCHRVIVYRVDFLPSMSVYRCINVGVFGWWSTIGQTKDRTWWLYPYIIIQFWLLVFERPTDAVAQVMW